MSRQQLTFDQALSTCSDLIDAIDSGETTAAQALPQLNEIMQSANGARGFFVCLLTGDSPLSENVPDELLTAFKNNSEIVFDLLAKNAVMSSATAYQHLQSGDQDNARKSISVAKKSMAIINKVNCGAMKSTMEAMVSAIDNKIAEAVVDESLHYAPFLMRWRYSKEQLDYARTLIAQGIQL